MATRELRLALICYGGVSLAVYMHGITREVWNLVRASRSAADGTRPPDPVVAVYRELLELVESRGGAHLRVHNDIIAGASAGGLNGVFLAQAIATGQSLAPLTRLWLESADVETLLATDARPMGRLSKLWAEPIAWAIARRRGGAVDETVSDEAKAEISAKLSQFVRARWFAPPFGGDTFTGLILDAFQAMADGPAGPRLLPPGQPLDLFITATDFHGRPQRLRLNSPPVVEEREHRVIFTLRNGPAGLASVPALTFAGRASASFPGAFPPMSLAELDRVLEERGDEWPTRAADLKRLLPSRSADGTVEEALLIDGSVLTNAPFGPALAALRSRPAKRPVDRRFVYLDPAPGHKAIGGGRAGSEPPGFFGTVFAALSTIPREQPIRDNLEAIAGRDQRVRRVRRIVDALAPDVEEQVTAAIGRPLFFDRPTAERLAKWSRAVAARAGAKVGIALVTYRELRLSQTCEQTGLALATAAMDEALTPQLTARLWHHIHERPDGVVDALETLDAGVRTRRLRHLARTVAELATSDRIASLEPLRELLFGRLTVLDESMARLCGCEVAAAMLASDAPSDALFARAAALRDLPFFDQETDASLADALADLPDDIRRLLLREWLGFPVLDIATLPLMQGEGLEEFDEIKVDRISPEDALSLGGGTAATLKGVEFNHFGAFFSRRYRENDYLWGRLHGAERMVDITLSTLRAADRPDEATVRQLKARLFQAILADEEPRLDQVGPLIAELGARATALASGVRAG